MAESGTPSVARFAHRAADGTTVYFESDGSSILQGRLQEGEDPSALEQQGYTFLNRDAFVRTRDALDPRKRNPGTAGALADYENQLVERDGVQMPRRTARRQNEADVEDLAQAFDASMGPQATGEHMNGQDAALDPEVLALFQQYMQEGRLPELFQPFQQEQNVLSQQMQLAEGLRQGGPQRSTPTGTLFGGLARAAGNIGAAAMQKKGLEGQTALGKRMQGDASGRTGAILRAAMKRRGMNPDTGLMDEAVDDATLSQIFSGG